MASTIHTNSALDTIDEPFYAALAFPDGTVITAETLTDLVSELIEDYPPTTGRLSDVTEQFEAMVGYATEQANIRQGLYAVVATNEGDFDPEVESEETLTAIFSSRDVFVPTFPVWEGSFPLVLVATNYYPFTDVPVPAGNVELIDPSNERTLLTSLADLGDFALVFAE